VRDPSTTGSTAEARWFVAGDLPADLRPRRRGRRRIDSYCVPSLSPASSVKRRGDRKSLEWKVRVGRVELVQYGAAVGFAECWVKQQIDESAPQGPWVDVDKQIWCVDGGEIARLRVAGGRWWTVAVRTDAYRTSDGTRLVGRMDPLGKVGTAHSYASWLTELCRKPAVRRSAGSRAA
jgi:hypothetical protein